MSEKLCTLRTQGGGGGAKQTETVLWTNSAPTSAFANQTVALSDDIDNYDYITFRYRNSTSVATENEVVYKVSDFKQLILANNTIHNTAGLVRQDASNNTFCRPFGYVSNTSIKFELCYRLYNASYNQTDCIPTSIIGIKNMGGRGWAAGPMFEIAASSGIYGSSNSYSINSVTNDSTLLSDYYVTTSSLTATVKRAAKGKLYFNVTLRGNVASHATVTIHNTSYRPYDYTSSDIQSGLDVEFAANDTVVFAAGTSGIFYNATMTFIED